MRFRGLEGHFMLVPASVLPGLKECQGQFFFNLKKMEMKMKIPKMKNKV